MKFNDKYPHLVNAVDYFKDNKLGPHQEVEAEPGIFQSWRYYKCDNCGTITGWVRYPDDITLGTHFCSEECLLNPKAVDTGLEEPEHGQVVEVRPDHQV